VTLLLLSGVSSQTIPFTETVFAGGIAVVMLTAQVFRQVYRLIQVVGVRLSFPVARYLSPAPIVKARTPSLVSLRHLPSSGGPFFGKTCPGLEAFLLADLPGSEAFLTTCLGRVEVGVGVGVGAARQFLIDAVVVCVSFALVSILTLVGEVNDLTLVARSIRIDSSWSLVVRCSSPRL